MPPLVATRRSPFGSAASSRALPTVATTSKVKPAGTVSAGAAGIFPGDDVEWIAPLHADGGPDASTPPPPPSAPAGASAEADASLAGCDAASS